MEINPLSPNVSVGAQIGPEDLQAVAREGFTDVVCNRPDAEHPQDPDAATMKARASELGLTFHYLPITHGEPFDAQARHLAELMGRSGAKVFAYCRSGARSASAWALARDIQSGDTA